MTYRLFIGLITIGAVLAGNAGAVYAQALTYTLKVVSETEPTGPGQTFYAKLVMEEHDTEVSTVQVKIGYDNARVDLTAIENNTGQPAAGAVFTLGTHEILMSGVAYANVYRVMLMDTGPFSIEPPVSPTADFNLGRLQFITKPGFNVTDGGVGIFLDQDTVGGVYDGNIDPLNVTYVSLLPGSSVADWAVY